MNTPGLFHAAAECRRLPTPAQLHAALKFAQARVDAFIADGVLDPVRRDCLRGHLLVQP